jgi:predicted amidohydrolase YtcJ
VELSRSLITFLLALSFLTHCSDRSKASSLEVGKYAGFIVLNASLLKAAGDQLKNIKVLSTIIGET